MNNNLWLVIKKYLLPLVLGIGFVVAYGFVVNEYHLNKGDFYLAIIVSILAVFGISANIEGPQIPNAKLNALYNNLSVQLIGPSPIRGFDINMHIDSETHIIKFEKSRIRTTIIMTVAVVIAGIILLKEDLYVLYASVSYSFMRMMIRQIRSIRNNEAELIMNTKGLATRETGFLTWQEVKRVRFKVTETVKSEITLLEVYLSDDKKKPEYTVDIDFLDWDVEELKKTLTELRGAAPESF